jgi:hypothetical protein
VSCFLTVGNEKRLRGSFRAVAVGWSPHSDWYTKRPADTAKQHLTLNPMPAFGFRSAANPEMLPQPKPRAMREHFVVPSIRRRDVPCAEWPDIWRFEHFL